MLLKKINEMTDPVVFWISNLIIFLLMMFTIIEGERFLSLVASWKTSLLESFGWLFILPIIWMIFFLAKIFFKYGDLKLGGKNAEVEFSTFSWVSMLFSAGLGIGLLYSGVYEPMSHFFKAPQVTTLDDKQRFLDALHITYFHWGLPAWIIYSCTGLMFAYVGFNQNRPLTFSSLLPEKQIFLKHFVNIFAIISILIGVIIVFSLGVQQINAGVAEVFGGIPVNKKVQSLLILLITVAATVSVLSGLKKGIKFLSVANVMLMGVLLLLGLSIFSVFEVLSVILEALGVHVSKFATTLTYSAALEDKTWMSQWTILFWAWWASWAPFVGLFIARISKGRTIKEFILGTILIPSVICFIWFSVFGLAGFKIHMSGVTDFELLVNEAAHKSLFVILDRTFIPDMAALFAVVSIIIFYITSSDSGSYIIDMIASGGKKNPHPYLKIYWSVIEGVLAAVLLFFGGVLFIKNLVILFALPIILYLCYGIYKLPKLLASEEI